MEYMEMYFICKFYKKLEMHEKKNILRIVKKIMPSHRFTSLEKLTEKERSVIGLGLIGLALLTGLLMYYQQGALRVPVFIAITALSIFLIAGVAILIYGKVSKEKYHQMIESLILFMCVIPLWIAFDPAEKQCRANLIFLS